MPNISSIPYPGKDNSCYVQGGLLKMNSISSQEEADISALIQADDDQSTLKRAFCGVRGESCYKNEAIEYDGAELWLYNGWHDSPNDDKNHATLRLFEDIDKSGEPWNGRSWHLYRDGTSKGWTHNKP